MEMLIGLSTAILWDYEELNIPKAISHAADNLNFEAVEIHCENPFFEGWGTEKVEDTKRNIKDALSTVNVEVSLHAPYHDVNIATVNAEIRRSTIRQLKECIETARYFDSEIVVVHPGFVSSRKFEKEMSFRQMVRGLREVTEAARDACVKICLENLASKRKAMCVGINELEKVLERIDMENFKLTLDVAHANTTEDGPLKYAEDLKEHIAHVHVSDNTGEDNHLSIGEGNIDFESVLKKLQPYRGIVMVEGWIPTDEDPFLIHDRRQLERIRSKLRS